MMIRGDWREFRGGPQPFREISGLFAAAVLVAWVSGTAMLVALLALLLRFL